MTQSQNWLGTHLKNSIGVLFLVAAAHTVEAQDTPYFVTYDHHMEEAGTLGIETPQRARLHSFEPRRDRSG